MATRVLSVLEISSKSRMEWNATGVLPVLEKLQQMNFQKRQQLGDVQPSCLRHRRHRADHSRITSLHRRFQFRQHQSQQILKERVSSLSG